MDIHSNQTLKREEIKVTSKEYIRENGIRFFGVFIEHIKTGIVAFATDINLFKACSMAFKDLENMMEIHIENKI